MVARTSAQTFTRLPRASPSQEAAKEFRVLFMAKLDNRRGDHTFSARINFCSLSHDDEEFGSNTGAWTTDMFVEAVYTSLKAASAMR